MVKACVIFEAIVVAETSPMQQRFVIVQAIVSSLARIFSTTQVASVKVDEHMEAKPCKANLNALIPCFLHCYCHFLHCWLHCLGIGDLVLRDLVLRELVLRDPTAVLGGLPFAIALERRSLSQLYPHYEDQLCM